MLKGWRVEGLLALFCLGLRVKGLTFTRAWDLSVYIYIYLYIMYCFVNVDTRSLSTCLLTTYLYCFVVSAQIKLLVPEGYHMSHCLNS